MERAGKPRLKFLIGGALIVTAVIYLIASSMRANAQYYYTIDELQARGGDPRGRSVRVLGAVIGDSIEYDPQTLTLRFTVANMPADTAEIERLGGLAAVLHDAVSDPDATLLEVVYVGPKPDLLRNEAQAVMTGKVGEDGMFYADELLLKCPTKYEDTAPESAEG